MTQSSTFYGILIGLLSLASDSSKVKRMVQPQAVVYNYDSAIAVQEYIAEQNLVEIREIKGK